MTALILVGTMVLLALLGVRLVFAIVIASVVALLVYRPNIPFAVVAQQFLSGVDNFLLLAVAFFFLAGELMNRGGVTRRIVAFAQTCVSHIRGGLGHVNVLSSVFFSGISGSAVADTAAVGSVMIPAMEKSGFSRGFAAAITQTSSVIGPIIPPSIPMVLYALVSDQSVGYLFAAGMAPGLLMGLVLMIMNMIIAHRRGFETDEAIPLRDMPGVTFRAIPALLLPVILLGGIYGGVMTPTEAAAVAAFYALSVSVVFYRSVSAGQFYQTLLASARSTATVGILIAGALTFQYVVTRENVPDSLAAFLGQYDLSKVGFLLAINLLFLVLGCILESGAILLIIVPIFIPTAASLGIDLVHFGVVCVVNAMLGLITPPYGLLLFIVQQITKQPMGRIVRDLLPFLLALFVALGVITFVPDFVLWLPRLLGYKG